MKEITLCLNNLSSLKKFASTLASYFEKKPGVIFLNGDLGAGKTTFTQFFAFYLGVEDYVTSPTFNIMKRYEGKQSTINHFDLYRIKSNVYDQGFEEYWSNDEEITIIEWSMYLDEELQQMVDLLIDFKIIDEDIRHLKINAKSEIIQFIKEHANEFIC